TYLGRVWATHRDVPVDDHIRAILAAINPGLPKRVPSTLMTSLIEAYSQPILVVPPAVDDTALAALESLNVGGYTLALISNVMRTPGVSLRRLLERFRLLRYFQHTTFSHEVRLRKPAPEIFHLTPRAVAGAPETSVHVGDDPILDVQGAQAAGMRVIQVTSSRTRRPRPNLTISRLAELPEAIERLESWSGGVRGRELAGNDEADLFEVAADRIRNAVGVRLEHAIRDAAMVGRAPEIAGPPAEHLRGPGLAVAQHESERPEPGDPVIGVV